MMEFIRIIKVMEEVVGDLKHNITLEVRFTDEDKPRIYQARTYLHEEKSSSLSGKLHPTNLGNELMMHMPPVT
ncbi:hypothetical protein AKJ16_DCAP07209 [Drosera capensis]